MSIIFLIAILLIVGFCQSSDKNFEYNKDVDSITMAMIRKLEIHHGIVVTNKEIDRGNWHDLKLFSFNYIPILYFNKEELLNYLIRDVFINVKTIIVFNEKNISNLKSLLQQLEEVSK